MEILEKVENQARTQPHHIALTFNAQHMTYAELENDMKIKSTLFWSIPKHSFVGLVIQNPQTTISLYLALLKRDCVPCVFDYRWTKEQINNLVEKYGIPYLMYEDHHLIHTKANNDKLDFNEDLLHIGFTSGTTRIPKAYYRGEKSWVKSFIENEQLFERAIGTIIAPGPLSHSLSLYACIYALYTGRAFIGQQYFDAENIMKNIQGRLDNIACFLVPTMIQACLSTQICIKGNHYILSTGDKLTLYHRQRVNTFFPNSDLIEFFGTSEASFISYNFNNSAPSESVGKLFQSVKMNVDQPDELGIGVLKIQSELAFSGYVEEGICYYTWIETGDFAFYDNNGYLYLRGRKHDRMIIGGRNVYPSEIENSAQQLHIFDEVIVINETHSKFGEIAVLLYTGDEEVTYKYFKSLMMQRLARYQIPSKIFKVKRMLYTQSGKIARSHMKQYYLKGEL